MVPNHVFSFPNDGNVSVEWPNLWEHKRATPLSVAPTGLSEGTSKNWCWQKPDSYLSVNGWDQPTCWTP